MSVNWYDIIEKDADIPAKKATLKEKSTLVGRLGIMMLSAGTSAWRVRSAMNSVSKSLEISCSADIGLISIEYTCIGENETYTQSISIPNTGVNTDKLMELELFVKDFEKISQKRSVTEIHSALDRIQSKPENHGVLTLGLAAATACGAFTFLLGGGIVEIICAFFGAGAGNIVRKKMLQRKISLFGNIGVSVAVSCFVYVAVNLIFQYVLGISEAHRAGYICAMLYVIPGFPLITGGIDMAKLDMRSGIERTTYAILIITVATMTGYAAALLCRFHPADFPALDIEANIKALLRIVASFLGVYNFSLMFNSTKKMALTAGLIGMLTNTLRLELIDFAAMPAGIAAFIGALCTGLIASAVNKKCGFPRISLTVPAIVIMVPGLYMYRGIYHIGLNDMTNGAFWLIKAILIVVALPLGLVTARLCTDKDFRHCT